MKSSSNGLCISLLPWCENMMLSPRRKTKLKLESNIIQDVNDLTTNLQSEIESQPQL